jgi:hypothetical protein
MCEWYAMLILIYIQIYSIEKKCCITSVLCDTYCEVFNPKNNYGNIEKLRLDIKHMFTFCLVEMNIRPNKKYDCGHIF